MNLQPSQLINDQVHLIPLQEEHFEQLFEVASDSLIWEQHPASDRFKPEVFRQFFDDAIASDGAFLIITATTQEVMGSTRFYDLKPDSAQITLGYTFLARKFWGGEYNKVIKKMLLGYAFESINSVVFEVGINNFRSQKALAKIGARLIHTIETETKQYLIFEIQKSDWLKTQTA